MFDTKDGSTAVPFSIEWFLGQEIGLFLFSSFIKETANEYSCINFCEEVYRFKKGSSRKRLRRARIIVQNFFTSPKRDPETNAVRIPDPKDVSEYPTEIYECDLYRVHPSDPALTSEQLKSAMENNMDFPDCSESIIGLKGSYREEVVKKVHEMDGECSESIVVLKGSYREELVRKALEMDGKSEEQPELKESSPENRATENTPEQPDDTENGAGINSSSLKLSKAIFDVAECIVLESLKRRYWEAFRESSHYQRLLNFLWYQDRRVVPDDFFVMRVLGRGGFGLVTGMFPCFFAANINFPLYCVLFFSLLSLSIAYTY
jgi:hypothetical protein